MRPALIPEWRRAWRLNSVQAGVALALLSLAKAELLPMLQVDLPSRLWDYVGVLAGLVIVWLRLRAQPGALQPLAPDQPPAAAEPSTAINSAPGPPDQR